MEKAQGNPVIEIPKAQELIEPGTAAKMCKCEANDRRVSGMFI